MTLPEYTPKGNESSYSGATLDSGRSDAEDITHSDLESEYAPSETSEDREFVVSDSESLSGISTHPSDPEGSGYPILNDEIGDVATSIKGVKALKPITKRTIDLNGRQVIQYLVLWYSWETVETVPR